MPISTDINQVLADLDFAELAAIQARIAELMQQRRSELMERLTKDAELIGATVKANGTRRGRRRTSKTPAPSE